MTNPARPTRVGEIQPGTNILRLVTVDLGLDYLHAFMGGGGDGPVDRLTFTHDLGMWIHDEGIRLGLPLNRAASDIYHFFRKGNPWNILGPAILVGEVVDGDDTDIAADLAGLIAKTFDLVLVEES